jgi:Holin of 3TMs, for gene-transfer release
MGVIGKILGAGRAAGGVAEVFLGNRAERDAMAGRLATAAVEQFGAEFARAGSSRFDGFVNGLNRLPRPLLALSTLGLFGYAMAEPGGFGTRMQSLALVPEPLWWLLGAIVSFYFGARELHHQRNRGPFGLAGAAIPASVAAAPQPPARLAAVPAAIDPEHNVAVEEWRRLRA